jgi:phosphoribosylamine--glycine ligase
MNVLILGGGGREHALAWKIAQSSDLEQLYIAPGNAGTQLEGTNVDLDVNDFEGIKALVLEKNINMVVVGPEAPLVNGIWDFFNEDEQLKEVCVIGPSKKGATLEGSKDFAKDFMKRHNIPTAKYGTFTKSTLKDGYAFLETMQAPYVLKADGLAGGKGVVILDTLSEAKAELKSMLAGAKFGAASSKVVIEEFLKGIELSVFIITDGVSYKLLPSAKDYKRIGDGDEGLNTGGMGAVSPVPFADREFMEKVDLRIIRPTVRGFAADEMPYNGFVFIGLMNVKGEPYVIEYNVRMGDPETEAVLPRLKSDLLDLFEGIASGTLSERDVNIDPRTTATVMMVAGGYPGSYEKGKAITAPQKIEKGLIFHAGTKTVGGQPVTNGGRVIAVTSYGKNIEDARKKCYESVEKVDFDGMYFRKDIGVDLIKKEPQKA